MMQRSYSDFDCAQEHPVAARYTKEAAKSLAAELNANRSARELEYEVEYVVGSESIELL